MIISLFSNKINGMDGVLPPPGFFVTKKRAIGSLGGK
jgi:hypothetical protein